MNKSKKTEFKAEWYDQYYASNIQNSGEYSLPPQKSMYYNLWSRAMTKINEEDVIADLGCGVGQLASLMIANNKHYSYGVDFSSEAIQTAKNNNISIKDKFFVGNLYDQSCFKIAPYNCVVMFEVLEHIRHDLKVINYIESGTKMICSLPSFDYKSHVRFFENEKQIHKRYNDYIDIKEIISVKCNKIIWLIIGIKK